MKTVSLQFQRDIGPKSTMSSQHFQKKATQVIQNTIIYPNRDVYQKSIEESKDNKPKLYLIESLDSFSRADKMQISQNKVQSITKTLELQLIARLAYIERMKSKEDFANFTFNPFSLEQHRPQFKSSYQVKDKKQKINILDGVQQTRKRNNMTFIKEKLSKVHHDMDRIHMSLIDKKNKQKRQCIHTDVKTTVNKQKKVINNKEFSFLDELVSRRQERQLTYEIIGTSLNIFKARPKRQDKCMLNCRQILNSHFFCNNSIMHNPQNKQGVKCLKQMSLISRQFINNQHHLINDDFRILSTDMILNFSDIYFEEIMLISAGILQHSQLRKKMKGVGQLIIEKDDEEIAIYNKPASNELFYADNMKHMPSLVQYQISDNLLKQKLMNYPLTLKEQQQYQLSADIQNKLKDLLQKQELLKRNKINDQILNNQIYSKKSQLLTMQLQKHADNDRQLIEKDIDKKIRLQKLHKDRSEGIKNRFVQQSVLALKKHNNQAQISEGNEKKQTTSRFNQQSRLSSQENKKGQETERKKLKPDRRCQQETQKRFSSPNRQILKRKSFSPLKANDNRKRTISWCP